MIAAARPGIRNNARSAFDVLLMGDLMRWTQSAPAGWAAAGFDDSSWAVGSQYFAFTDVAFGTPRYYYPGVLNKHGDQVSVQGGADAPLPTQYASPSVVYARRLISVPVTATYNIRGICDNNLDIYLDGGLAANFHYSGGPLFSSTIALTAGTHVIAYRGTGDSFYDGHGVALWK